MKQLPVQSTHYNYLEKSFGAWLTATGFAPKTAYSMPLHVRELFYYLEQKNVQQITAITSEHIKQYYKKLKQRSNQRQDGALSPAHLNKHQQALKNFFEYLRQSGRAELPLIQLKRQHVSKKKINVLTVEEIRQLYTASYTGQARSKKEELGERDRAMLSIYYGCGLRRNEGRTLNLHDIDFDKGTVHVKQGKGNKERFVPLTKNNLKHLENYIYNSRYVLLEGTKSEALFISQRGKRMNDLSLNLRLHVLVNKTENPELIEKNPSLHTLRHSIATHLLQNGMKLEHIAKFLGHSSLDSTQIYTHLIDKE